MKTFPHRAAAFALLSFLASPAFASSHLTPGQCRDYPFVRSAQPPTHQQLNNELSELESVGYSPASGDDATYPSDLQAAEQRLQAKYRKDCAPSATGTLAASMEPRTATQQ